MKILQIINKLFHKDYSQETTRFTPRYVKIGQTKFGMLMLDTLTNTRMVLTNHHLIILK